MKTALITGTTSGLGEALLRHYVREGWRVVSVNRREVPALSAEFPKARFLIADITNAKVIEEIMKSLSTSGEEPDVVILNAGINEVDNADKLDLSVFNKVLSIDLNGVLTFVQAIQALGWKGKSIVGISSTSTLVPNSKNLAYYVSKLSMNKLFKIFSRCDQANSYKVVILGPVHTLLNRNLPAPEGIQAKIFNFLSQQPEEAAARCARFAESSCRVQFPPLPTLAFYALLRALLIVKPGFYYKPYQVKGS